jgi:hypothetical protein
VRVTAAAPARLPAWSDARERGESFHGSDLQIAIANYFGERNAAEIRRLKFENERLRDELEARELVGGTGV